VMRREIRQSLGKHAADGNVAGQDPGTGRS